MHERGLRFGLILTAVSLALALNIGPGEQSCLLYIGPIVVNPDIFDETGSELIRYLPWPLAAYGLIVTVFHGHRLLIDRQTQKNGKDGFAVVADLVPLKAEYDGVPRMRVHLLVGQENGQILEMTETPDGNPARLKVGEIVRVRYTGKDVNICSKYDPECLDPDVVRRFDKECRRYQAEKYPFEW